ncbi:MAG: hypothetical protein ACI4M6_02160 [Christensenellaceae bacterium]
MKQDISLKMLIIISERGYADKICTALDMVAHFPSITRSKGTAPNDILTALGIGEPEKDLLICFCEQKNVSVIYKILDEELNFRQKHLGIAMTVPVSSVAGNVTLQILLGKTRNLL